MTDTERKILMNEIISALLRCSVNVLLYKYIYTHRHTYIYIHTIYIEIEMMLCDRYREKNIDE